MLWLLDRDLLVTVIRGRWRVVVVLLTEMEEYSD